MPEPGQCAVVIGDPVVIDYLDMAVGMLWLDGYDAREVPGVVVSAYRYRDMANGYFVRFGIRGRYGITYDTRSSDVRRVVTIENPRWCGRKVLARRYPSCVLHRDLARFQRSLREPAVRIGAAAGAALAPVHKRIIHWSARRAVRYFGASERNMTTTRHMQCAVSFYDEGGAKWTHVTEAGRLYEAVRRGWKWFHSDAWHGHLPTRETLFEVVAGGKTYRVRASSALATEG